MSKVKFVVFADDDYGQVSCKTVEYTCVYLADVFEIERLAGEYISCHVDGIAVEDFITHMFCEFDAHLRTYKDVKLRYDRVNMGSTYEQITGVDSFVEATRLKQMTIMGVDVCYVERTEYKLSAYSVSGELVTIMINCGGYEIHRYYNPGSYKEDKMEAWRTFLEYLAM